jgi:hypothetical protein
MTTQQPVIACAMQRSCGAAQTRELGRLWHFAAGPGSAMRIWLVAVAARRDGNEVCRIASGMMFLRSG